MTLTPEEITRLLSKKRLTGGEGAEIILGALERHPGGLGMKMLLHLTGLRSGQYRSAYNWTLNNFDEPIWIKNYVDGEWIYLTTENFRSCEEDWARTIRTQVTRATREHNKAHMIAQRHPTIDNRLSEELARTRLEQLKIEKERLGS